MSSSLAVRHRSQQELYRLSLQVWCIGILRAYFHYKTSQILFLLDQRFVVEVAFRVGILLVLIFIFHLLKVFHQLFVLVRHLINGNCFLMLFAFLVSTLVYFMHQPDVVEGVFDNVPVLEKTVVHHYNQLFKGLKRESSE